jgi:hypothetical protein
MSNNALLFSALLIKALWVFAVMGTTAYAVFWLGFSGWWFLLAILLISGPTTVKAS